MNPMNSYFIGLVVGIVIGTSLGFSAAILAVSEGLIKLG